MRWRTSVLFGVCLAVFASGLAVAAQGEMPITTSSPEARALFLKARDLADDLELAEAMRLCDQAIEKDPSFAMAYALRASAGGMSSYRQSMDKAVELAGQVSAGEKLSILTDKAMADGRPTEARKTLPELLRMFPGDKHVQLQAASYFMSLGNQSSQALSHLEKATTIDPAFAPAYNELGYLQIERGELKAAEKSFLRYIELRPERPNPYDSYAELLMKMGRFDESIEQYRKALQKDDRFTSSLGGIGNNLILKRDYEGARKAFEQQRDKAFDERGKLAATGNIARSYVAEGKFGEATQVYEKQVEEAKAAQAPVAGVEAALSAAFALTRSGNLEGAAQWVSRSEELLSDSDVPAPVKARLQRSAQLHRASIDTAAGEYARAQSTIDAVRPAIEQEQDPGEIRSLNAALGSLALEQRRYTEAVQYLTKAGDRDAFVLYQRATALAATGKTAQAAALFQKVADWNSGGLGYALVRDAAREKATTAPVATAGRKKQP